MENIILLVSCTTAIFLVMSICAFIPICIVARQHRLLNKSKSSSSNKNSPVQLSSGSRRIISFCNCMAGGVFMAMCFLGLLPYSKEKFAHAKQELQFQTDFPVSEFIVVLGFFLILTIEQAILQCTSSGPDKCSSEAKEAPTCAYFHQEEECDTLLTDCSSVPNDDLTIKYAAPVQARLSDQNHCSDHVADLMTISSQGWIKFAILFFAISLHSLFEGIALGLQTDHIKILHLFFAIVFHEALVAFSVGINMTRYNLSLLKSSQYIVLFTSTVPVGIILGIGIQQLPGVAGIIISVLLQSLAAGIFIHVIFLGLIPQELVAVEGPKDPRLIKVLFFFLGFLTLVIINVTFGSHH